MEYIIRGISESQANTLRRVLRRHRSLAGLASQLEEAHFGTVTWSRDDIREKFFEQNSRQPSNEQIETILSTHHCRHIDDFMVEHGWEVIENAILEVC